MITRDVRTAPMSNFDPMSLINGAGFVVSGVHLMAFADAIEFMSLEDLATLERRLHPLFIARPEIQVRIDERLRDLLAEEEAP